MKILGVGLLLALAGCTAKLTGNVTIDGAAFTPTTCRSGQALGFSGIEVTDAGGRRLRLLVNADGTTSTALFAAGADRGDLLGECGTLSMHAQHSRINNVQNLAGTATLSCDAIGHKVAGKLDFENCH